MFNIRNPLPKLKLSFPAVIGVGVLLLLSVSNLLYPGPGSRQPVTPSPAPTPTPGSGFIRSDTAAIESAQFRDFRLSTGFSYPDFPDSYRIYPSRLENIDLRPLAASIASYFKLSPDPRNPYFWTDKTKSISLMFNYRTNDLALSRNKFVNPDPWLVKPGLNPPTLLKSATSFLNQFSPTRNLYPEPEGSIYYLSTAKSSEYEPVEMSAANLIDFNFSPINLDYLARIEAKPDPFVSVLVNSSGDIMKVEVKHQKITVSSEPMVQPAITKEQFRQNLLSGQPNLIYTFVPNLVLFSEPPGVTFTGAEVEYRFDQQQLKLIPYFRISAQLSSASKPKPINATFLMPAVIP